MIAGFDVYQLGVDPKPVAATLHRTFEHIADVQLTPDLLHVDSFALEGERRVARDHERASDARQVRGEALGYAIGEIVLLGIATDVREREHDDGQARRGKPVRHCAVLLVWAKPIPFHGVGPYRTSDILEVLLAQIGELDINFAANLIIGRRRDADATGFGDALQPSRDVDAITENIIALNEDVAEVDPDPKQHLPVLRDPLIALGQQRLHRNRAIDRIDNRGKLDQQAIAGSLDDTPTMFRYHCVGYNAVFAQNAGGACFVETHQPRIASHVGGHYRRQPASDPAWLIRYHSPQNPLGVASSCTISQPPCNHARREISPPGPVHLADAGHTLLLAFWDTR